MDENTRISTDDLKLFQESLERATGQYRFYECFYERLFGESEEIGAFFRNRDMQSIISKLQVTLMMVAETAEGKPGLVMYLEMLGGIHRRLEVAPRFFRLWRNGLIATVAEHDPQYNDEIRLAWERVIDQVIAYMHQSESDN